MACCGGEFVTRSIPARSPAPPPRVLIMMVTADVFQESSGWLKSSADLNMLIMMVVVLKVHPTWRAKKALD